MLREILLMAVSLAGQLLLFYAAGCLLLSAVKMQGGLCDVMIAGYTGYFACFEVIALICIFAGFTTRTLSFMMLAAAALTTAVSVYTGSVKKVTVSLKNDLAEQLKDHSYMLIFLAAAVLAECFIVALYVDMSQDSLFYVGTASTAVYTNTLFRFDAFTGSALDALPQRYVFFCYPLHAAVLSVLTLLPAVIASRVVMPVLSAIMLTFIWHRIARIMFREGSVKYADLMVILMHVLLFMGNTPYLPASFFFGRLYEGKALLANLGAALIFLCGLMVFEGESCRHRYLMLALSAMTVVCFSGSSYIILFSGAVFVFLAFLKHRSFRELFCCGLCFAPAACVWALYVCAKLGILPLALGRG